MLKLPTIRGLIERRILANFRIEPETMQANLPKPFRPIVVNGFGIGGICLIRLKGIRPKFFPFPWGIGSENAAHRFAVEWDEDGKTRRGVYIPRRDTNSILNAAAGGRIFPGEHHRARFQVKESENHLSVALKSLDGKTEVIVAGSVCSSLPETSVFKTLGVASEFFKAGSLGYSATRTAGRFDGIELVCPRWTVESLQIERIESSFFGDRVRFPVGTIEFDCALLMRQVQHEWIGREDLCC